MARSWFQGNQFYFFVLLICSASIIVGTKGCVKKSNTTLLHLLNCLKGGYVKELRPVRNWKNATTIFIDVILYAILLVNEKQQIMTVQFMYTRLWRDEFLQWNPEEFENVSLISLPKNEIWIPDVQIDEFYDSPMSLQHSFVYINHTGYVNYQKKLRLVLSCMFNIRFFPFDVHTCNMTFQSQIHTIEHMTFTSVRSEEELNKEINNFYHMGEWQLLCIKRIETVWEHHDAKVARIIFQITFRRHPLYYVVNLILPSVFLMVIGLSGFYIPPNSGERISFMITVLLGYSVFLVVVSETLPPSALGTPIIDVYFVVCMVFLVLSLMESIFIVRLINKKDSLSRVPTWLKDLSLGKKSMFLSFWKKNHPCETDRDISDVFQEMENSSGKLTMHMIDEHSTKNSSEGNLPRKVYNEMLEDILKEIIRIRQNFEDNDQQTDSKNLQVIFALDQMLFRIYLVIVFTYIVTLAILWSYNSSA